MDRAPLPRDWRRPPGHLRPGRQLRGDRRRISALQHRRVGRARRPPPRPPALHPGELEAPGGRGHRPELRFPTGSAESFLGGNGFIFAPEPTSSTRSARASAPQRRPPLPEHRPLHQPHRGERAHRRRRRRGLFPRAASSAVPSSSPRRPSPRPSRSRSRPTSDSNTASATTPWEFLVGARTLFGKHWGATLAVGRGIASDAGYGREAFRILGGVRYEFEPEPAVAPLKDRDHDGVPDERDRCPDEPGDGPEMAAPILDWDKDGIPNVDDRCPREPGTRSWTAAPTGTGRHPRSRGQVPRPARARRERRLPGHGAAGHPRVGLASGSTAASTSTPTRRSSS